MISLKDKVIIVTGGTGLLGRTYCKELASQGAIVIMADLEQASPKEIASETNKDKNLNIMGMDFDVTNEREVISLFK